MNTNRANHLVSARNAFRAVLTAITVAAAVLVHVPAPADAARRIRPGDACSVRLTGISRRDPSVICIGLTLRNRTRVWKWIPLGPTEFFPSDDAIRQYGGIIEGRAVSPTTSLPPSPAGAGAPCLEGAWTANSEALNSFVASASGSPGPFFTSGSHRYEFRGGVFTGSGSVQMDGDPSGLVTGSATATSRAAYTASDTAVTLRGATAFLSIEIKVNGTPIPIPIANNGDGPPTPYNCTAATLKLTIALASGRTTALVLGRA